MSKPKTQKTKESLSHKDMKHLYELMSHPMISFDCGELCSDAGGGRPICCDHENFHPLLFTDELKWLRAHKKAYWKKFKPKTKFDKKEVRELCDHLVYADCPGISNCDRDKRALVCRLFPFEPHVNSKGKVRALAFITDNPEKCPLVGKPLKIFNRKYVKASIKAWQSIVDTYPAEKALYISESRKRKKKARKNGIRLRLLRK